MEKVRVASEDQHPEGQAPFDAWYFTDDEKKEIRRVIRRDLKPKVEKEEIDRFISQLEQYCMIEKERLELREMIKADLGPGKYPKDVARKRRELILTDCKAALGHLLDVTQGRVDLAYGTTMLDIVGKGRSPNAVFGFRIDCMADNAAKALAEFIEALEEYHRAEVKRPWKDHPTEGDHFFRTVAELYREHLGEPTSHVDKCFYTVVQKVLEALGLPCDDPRRTVRAALKKI